MAIATIAPTSTPTGPSTGPARPSTFGVSSAPRTTCATACPAAGSVQVTIYDAAWEEIYQDDLELDEFGAFHGELELAEGASLGDYTIQAVFGDEYFYGQLYRRRLPPARVRGDGHAGRSRSWPPGNPPLPRSRCATSLAVR